MARKSGVKLVLGALLMLGCGEAPAQAGNLGGDQVGAAGSAGAGSSALVPPRCSAPAGASASPRNIEEAVVLLNALPKPTTVACFVETLPRPLAAVATTSTASAQPAGSPRSPRIFLKLDQLLLSVVIDGQSRDLIEFGYLVEGDLRSIKGELKLPLDGEVEAQAPYQRVQRDAGTVCGYCHAGEERVAAITFASAFVSAALRPNPAHVVGLDALRAERQACDPAREPARCEMLSALFDGGDVVDAQLNEAMPVGF